MGARDDDARLDAAALVFVLAGRARRHRDRGERARAAGGVDLGDRRVLAGRGAGALAEDGGAPVPPVGALALRIVAMLEPDDRDLPRLQAPTAELRAGCGG